MGKIYTLMINAEKLDKESIKKEVIDGKMVSKNVLDEC